MENTQTQWRKPYTHAHMSTLTQLTLCILHTLLVDCVQTDLLYCDNLYHTTLGKIIGFAPTNEHMHTHSTLRTQNHANTITLEKSSQCIHILNNQSS